MWATGSRYKRRRSTWTFGELPNFRFYMLNKGELRPFIQELIPTKNFTYAQGQRGLLSDIWSRRVRSSCSQPHLPVLGQTRSSHYAIIFSQAKTYTIIYQLLPHAPFISTCHLGSNGNCNGFNDISCEVSVITNYGICIHNVEMALAFCETFKTKLGFFVKSQCCWLH